MQQVLAKTSQEKYKEDLMLWTKKVINKKISVESRNEILIVSFLIETFFQKFLELLNEMKKDFRSVRIDLDKALPFPFNQNAIESFGGIYSLDRKQVLLLFGQTTGDNRVKGFFNQSVLGNPFDHFGYRFDLGVGNFKIPTGIDIKKLNLELPLRITNEYNFINGEVKMDYYSILIPGYMLAENLRNIKQYVRDFVAYHWGKYTYEKEIENQSYIDYLKEIENKMAKIFFDETVDELKIDKFIEENPAILEHGLSLIDLKHQVKLENILGLYEKSLKPDLIAYDLLAKNWVIVDYKKAKKSIIKNVGKVRTGFRSDVNNLENQLEEYIGYFEEKEQRDYILKRYGIEVKNPEGIGIIGNVLEGEREAFIRLMKNKLRWFRVVPYNYLYDNFCRYIKQAEKHVER